MSSRTITLGVFFFGVSSCRYLAFRQCRETHAAILVFWWQSSSVATERTLSIEKRALVKHWFLRNKKPYRCQQTIWSLSNRTSEENSAEVTQLFLSCLHSLRETLAERMNFAIHFLRMTWTFHTIIIAVSRQREDSRCTISYPIERSLFRRRREKWSSLIDDDNNSKFSSARHESTTFKCKIE